VRHGAWAMLQSAAPSFAHPAMISPDTAAAFFGIAVLLALAPGPDNVFVLLQSAMWGRRAGLTVVIGLCTGLVVHTAAVALGLAAALAAMPAALSALKLAGAAYLLWLAWQALRAPAGSLQGNAPRLGLAALYRRGVIMSTTNPKLLLFFLAFLPQFVQPGRGPAWLQVAQLGVLFMLAALLIFSTIAFFSGQAGALLRRSPRAWRLLNQAAGVVFALLALRLLLD